MTTTTTETNETATMTTTNTETNETATMTTTNTKAFDAGLKDGAEWDLDGFATLDDADKQSTGWDEATINAVGEAKLQSEWGFAEWGDDSFRAACADYNRGVSQAVRGRVASSR